MKKLITILVLFFVCKTSFGQSIPIGSAYPVPQALGNTPSTLVTTNTLRAVQGVIPGYFSDTTSANLLPYLKHYPGAVIFCSSTNSLWLRNTTATLWIEVGSGGGGVNIYNSDGTLTANRTVQLSTFLLNFDRGANKQLELHDTYSKLYSPNNLKIFSLYDDSVTLVGVGQSASSSDSVIVTTASGELLRRAQSDIIGVTPTWQETLNSTGGSILIDPVSVSGTEPFSLDISSGGVIGGLTLDVGVSKLSAFSGVHASYLVVHSDSISINAPFGELYVDSLNYTLSTTGKKIMLRDTATGLVENIDPALIGGGSVPISSLTAATGTNSIDNGDYTQQWLWNSLQDDSGLSLGSSSTAIQASTNAGILDITFSGANANSGVIADGIDISVSKTGTTSTNRGIQSSTNGATTNVGGQFAASGGTNNYAIIVPASSGSVGIGTSTPAALLEIGAGSTSAGGSPLKFNSASPTTVGVAGQLMFKDGMLILDSTSSHRDTLATRNWVRNNASGGGSSGTSYGIDSTVKNGTSGSVLYVGTGSKLRQSNSTFYFDSTNSRLIIGAASGLGRITSSLSTTDYTNTNGANTLFLADNPSSTGQSSMMFRINGTNIMKFRGDYVGNLNWIAYAGSHYFYTGGDFGTGSSKMIILNSGFVGIGTTYTPTSLFDVSNQFKVASTGAVTINDDGNAADTRIEGDTDANLFFTKGSTDRVGIGTASPASKLDVAGSFSAAYVAKTGSYTLTAADFTVSNTSGSNTMTLPTAVGITGRIYYIVNTDAAATVTVATTSSQTFVNFTATPTTLTKVGLGTFAFQSNGANWMVLSNY